MNNIYKRIVNNIDNVTDTTMNIQGEHHSLPNEIDDWAKSQDVTFIELEEFIGGPPTSCGYYEVYSDTITLKPRHKYSSKNSYYSCMFHELIHMTNKHLKRMNWELYRILPFVAAQEEITAQFGAMILLDHFGLLNDDMMENSLRYIAAVSKWDFFDKEQVRPAWDNAVKAVELLMLKKPMLKVAMKGD